MLLLMVLMIFSLFIACLKDFVKFYKYMQKVFLKIKANFYMQKNIKKLLKTLENLKQKRYNF